MASGANINIVKATKEEIVVNTKYRDSTNVFHPHFKSRKKQSIVKEQK
jgi:hypothetical protein